jgi:hypothetical protein
LQPGRQILHILNAWHIVTYAGCGDTGWRLGAIEIKSRSNDERVVVSNSRTMNQILNGSSQEGEKVLRAESPEK